MTKPTSRWLQEELIFGEQNSQVTDGEFLSSAWGKIREQTEAGWKAVQVELTNWYWFQFA